MEYILSSAIQVTRGTCSDSEVQSMVQSLIRTELEAGSILEAMDD